MKKKILVRIMFILLAIIWIILIIANWKIGIIFILLAIFISGFFDIHPVWQKILAWIVRILGGIALGVLFTIISMVIMVPANLLTVIFKASSIFSILGTIILFILYVSNIDDSHDVISIIVGMIIMVIIFEFFLTGIFQISFLKIHLSLCLLPIIISLPIVYREEIKLLIDPS